MKRTWKEHIAYISFMTGSRFWTYHKYIYIHSFLLSCLISNFFFCIVWWTFWNRWNRLRISPYSVRMRENADQNNTEYGHFLCSNTLGKNIFWITSIWWVWKTYRKINLVSMKSYYVIWLLPGKKLLGCHSVFSDWKIGLQMLCLEKCFQFTENNKYWGYELHKRV